MRPLSLEFTAFGPYPGTQSVDFTELDELGLYVVSGPTGSGKTTIFDAMAYALYGDAPGARDAVDVRSQHAPLNTRCSVIFRFEVDGITYRVERTPDQKRERARGSGGPVDDPASATLTRESDGEALASKPRSCKEECERLLGLDLSQFERVVLLPQGRFQQFLLSSSEERVKLLRKLFGSGRWLDVLDRLKTDATVAAERVRDIENQFDHQRTNALANLDAFEDIHRGDDDAAPTGLGDVEPEEVQQLGLDEIEARLLASRERIAPEVAGAAEAARVATEAEAKGNTARSDADRFDLHAELVERERRLIEDRTEIALLDALVTAHTDAAPVAAAHSELEIALSGFTSAEAALGSIAVDLHAAMVTAGLDPEIETNELAGAIVIQRAAIERRRGAITELRDAVAVRDQVLTTIEELDAESTALEGELTELGDRSSELEARIVEVEAVAATEPRTGVELEAARRRVGLRNDLDDAIASLPALRDGQTSLAAEQRRITTRFIESTAPRLAESLIDGEPCVVCGSIDHPAPAVGEFGDVSSDDIERIGTKLAEIATKIGAVTVRCDQLTNDLGDDRSKSAEELGAELGAAEATHRLASEAVEMLVDLRAERAAIANRSAEIESRRAAIAAESLELVPKRTKSQLAVDQAESVLGADANRAMVEADVLVEEIDARLEGLDHLDELRGRLDGTTTELAGRKAIVEQRESDLRDRLAASPFSTVDEALDATVETSRREEACEMLANHEKATDEVRIELERVRSTPLPKTRPDVDSLVALAVKAREESDRLKSVLARMQERLDQAEADLAEARSIEVEAGGIIAERDRARSLFETAKGSNRLQIALETWVLSAELDRVTTAANHHLVRMSGGRYRIERTDQRARHQRTGGLDLAILDAHTGQSRRPASLSGGEQFQASLALALGLAEVISHGRSAGGRIIESLFVDEGFGSLDPDALDQAVEALSELRSGGRIVGVITHVESMKDSLPLGIRVERLPDGRGSTLVVRPEG